MEKGFKEGLGCSILYHSKLLPVVSNYLPLLAVVELRKSGGRTTQKRRSPKAKRLRRSVLHGYPQSQWGGIPGPRGNWSTDEDKKIAQLNDITLTLNDTSIETYKK